MDLLFWGKRCTPAFVHGQSRSSFLETLDINSAAGISSIASGCSLLASAPWFLLLGLCSSPARALKSARYERAGGSFQNSASPAVPVWILLQLPACSVLIERSILVNGHCCHGLSSEGGSAFASWTWIILNWYSSRLHSNASLIWQPIRSLIPKYSSPHTASLCSSDCVSTQDFHGCQQMKYTVSQAALSSVTGAEQLLTQHCVCFYYEIV